MPLKIEIYKIQNYYLKDNYGFALQIYSIVIYRNFHIKLSSPIYRQIFLQLNYTTFKKLVNRLF